MKAWLPCSGYETDFSYPNFVSILYQDRFSVWESCSLQTYCPCRITFLRGRTLLYGNWNWTGRAGRGHTGIPRMHGCWSRILPPVAFGLWSVQPLLPKHRIGHRDYEVPLHSLYCRTTVGQVPSCFSFFFRWCRFPRFRFQIHLLSRL